MSRIVVILTQPVENNTSSMIRCSSIISAMISNGNDVTCYCPYPDKDSIYYGKSICESDFGTVRRYGNKNPIKINNNNNSNESKGIKRKAISLAYKIFKKVDVFGSSLQYLKYKKALCVDIAKYNFDVLITFSHPMTAHMIGKYCKSRLNIKYVQQWGDPLTTDITGKTALPRIFRYHIENALLKSADRVCYVSPFTNEEQKELFKKQAGKMIFLPTPCVEYAKCEKTERERIKIGYFGSYHLNARDIRPLYEAACRVKECDFLFIGDSGVQLESKENIQVIDRVSRDKLEKYIDETDVLVCLMNSKGNQIPGKVYHYAGSYKEILLIKDGEFGDKIEDFFAKYDRYTFVENNADKIEQALIKYNTCGIPSRKPLEAFKAENIAAELLSGISDTAAV